jgi:hypothetical protein
MSNIKINSVVINLQLSNFIIITNDKYRVKLPKFHKGFNFKFQHNGNDIIVGQVNNEGIVMITNNINENNNFLSLLTTLSSFNLTVITDPIVHNFLIDIHYKLNGNFIYVYFKFILNEPNTQISKIKLIEKFIIMNEILFMMNGFMMNGFMMNR